MDRPDHPGGALPPILDAVQAKVSYLRASTSAPPEEDWIRSRHLVDGSVDLHELITSTGEARGAHEPQVAASLFVQGYAFRIPGVALAAHALGLGRPSLAIDATAFRIARNRPAAVAYLDPDPRPDDVDALAAEVVGHLASVIDAVRDVVTVGERMLWGNVAASCAVAYRAVEGESPEDRQTIRERADEFFAAVGPRLDGLGEFVVVDGPERDGWFWQRTNCCLWYQTADGSKCDDCSLLDPEERLAGWRRQLELAS